MAGANMSENKCRLFVNNNDYGCRNWREKYYAHNLLQNRKVNLASILCVLYIVYTPMGVM